MNIEDAVGKTAHYRPLYSAEGKFSKVVSVKEMQSFSGRTKRVFLSLENGETVDADTAFYSLSETA